MNDHAPLKPDPHALPSQRTKNHIPGEAGIWIFVAGDLVVFTLFFVLIALGHVANPDLFATSRSQLNLWAGVANTLLLLTCSWFVAIGVERCRSKACRSATPMFVLALLCALGFIANKIWEWHEKLDAGITPATNDFFMYFYVFTGIHLFHVVLGVGVLLFLTSASRRPSLAASDLRSIESGATFWHLVDLLWVALFALFYLL